MAQRLPAEYRFVLTKISCHELLLLDTFFRILEKL